MLKIENLSVGYYKHVVLKDINLEINPGEIVALFGANASGKSTLANSIVGLGEAHIHSGKVFIDGEDVTPLIRKKNTYKLRRKGLHISTQQRHIFPTLTVREVLQAASKRAHSSKSFFTDFLRAFPSLKGLMNQDSSTLSGGERTLLNLATATIGHSKALILDEPFAGLSQETSQEVSKLLNLVKDLHTAVLLIEHREEEAKHIADRSFFIENGRIVPSKRAYPLRGPHPKRGPKQRWRFLRLFKKPR